MRQRAELSAPPTSSPPPPARLPYSQNSVTGEVKLLALRVSHRLLFLRIVSSIHWGVFQLWLQCAQGSSDWKDWNR